MRSQILLLTLIATGLSATGCVPVLTQAIVSAPNRFNPLAGKMNLASPLHRLLGIQEEFWVQVGPPHAMLLVSVMEPARSTSPRGTVLLLHGIYGSSAMMTAHAQQLSEHGYRAVLVDLRGHGQSSGELLSYGAQESQDLRQVIDVLQSRGLAGKHLGVLGISYGAATAVHLAGIDPRISTVVAIAPFASMRGEVPHYLQTVLPGLQYVVSDEQMNVTVDSAGTLAGFNPDSQQPRDRIRQTQAKVLILHGQDDWLVPAEQGMLLQQSAASNVELELLPNLGHTTIWLDSSGQVRARSLDWFERHPLD